LRHYYANGGRADNLLIALPDRGYTPTFQWFHTPRRQRQFLGAVTDQVRAELPWQLLIAQRAHGPSPPREGASKAATACSRDTAGIQELDQAVVALEIVAEVPKRNPRSHEDRPRGCPDPNGTTAAMVVMSVPHRRLQRGVRVEPGRCE